jgi:hypothetical protein
MGEGCLANRGTGCRIAVAATALAGLIGKPLKPDYLLR